MILCRVSIVKIVWNVNFLEEYFQILLERFLRCQHRHFGESKGGHSWVVWLILGCSRGNGSSQLNQILFLKARAQHSSPTFVREYFNHKTLNLGIVSVTVGFFGFWEWEENKNVIGKTTLLLWKCLCIY